MSADSLNSGRPERGKRLLATIDLADDGIHEVEALVDGLEESLIVMRVEGRALAFLNVCPHAGRRLDWAPGQFLVDRGLLLCAVHGASFERTGGLCVAGPCRGNPLRAVAVLERDGWVSLDETDPINRAG